MNGESFSTINSLVPQSRADVYPSSRLLTQALNDSTRGRLTGDRETDKYRAAVRRKISAYHRHMQLGLVAQGLLQILAAKYPQQVWRSFGSWIRTIRPGLAPSELVVAIALRNTLPEYLAAAAKRSILVKFIRDRLDLSRSEGINLAA